MKQSAATLSKLNQVLLKFAKNTSLTTAPCDVGTIVDDCVKRIKAGDVGAEVERRLLLEAKSLSNRGADVIIVGCTELPLVLSDELVSYTIVSNLWTQSVYWQWK
eukprot:scaffold5103_cov115-Skeletonema_dohrnii-CCMP3373.AAC.2